MPYEFGWMDERRRILKIQPADSLNAEELEQLAARLSQIAGQGGPIRLLVNLRDFAWKNLPSFDDSGFTLPEPPPSDVSLALVGGGVLFKLLSSLLNDLLSYRPDTGSLRFRVFEHEDEAYAWLSALADGLVG